MLSLLGVTALFLYNEMQGRLTKTNVWRGTVFKLDGLFYL